MTNNLAAEIEKVLELDKARTQGEWFNAGGTIWFIDIEQDRKGDPYQVQRELAGTNEIDGNFIAAAPLMVEIIKALRAENERYKIANRIALEALWILDRNKISDEIAHNAIKKIEQALSTPSDGSGK